MRFLLVLCCTLLFSSASAKESPYIDLTGIDNQPQAESDDASSENISPRQLFDEIAAERLSPCGDPETLADAFTKEPPCLLAVAYGRLLGRLLRSGFSRNHINKFLERVEKNYKKPPAKIDVTDRPARGPENAPVVVVEFADYECPYCGRLEPILQQVLAKHPEMVKHYFLNFPLTQMHPMADAAARAAVAAKRQGKFWEMHDLLYERQNRLAPEILDAWAKELGLNVEQFQKDMTSAEVAAEVAADLDQALVKLHIDGTPTLFINGRHYIEANTEEALDNALLLAYAEATGDTSSFLIDPSTAVRIKARAALADLLFWIITGVMIFLIPLLLMGLFRRQAKKSIDTKATNPLVLVLKVSGVFVVVGGVAFLGVDGYLTNRFGPGDSWVGPWLFSSLALASVAVIVGLFEQFKRNKS